MTQIILSLDDTVPLIRLALQTVPAKLRTISKQVAVAVALVLFTVSTLPTAVSAEGFSFFNFSIEQHLEQARAYADAKAQEAIDQDEILWFARAIHSESEYTDEQNLVAWVIRNRVENAWYPDTYRGVVLQPYQFSGLNSFDPKYEYNVSREYDSEGVAWQRALAVAHDVYYAGDSERLLHKSVYHFYSPVAVREPAWARGHTPVKSIYGRDGVRFAFYSGIK